ncbi:hypothetical protein IC229_01535 [Spirosoma sp. BT702]|uniref:Tetratricopeptide repeat protein n=1 Tax=Spirosoma profusum TaxID=2771354 RepID=A0A927AM89_9BACT|nr:hypothetical protein [Spirosoma profusum]MBD2699299.1 hypothetical protein [Spirosoma profusum]
MTKPLHRLIFLLLILFVASPSTHVISQVSSGPRVVDDEYERYKKRADDFFKEGRYVEARRQYQNCLEVPGFENDAYAKSQFDECTTGITLRQQADDAFRAGKNKEAIQLLVQLINLNPDDALTKGQLLDYYERQGNQLFNQQQYIVAKNNYREALKYATPTKRETLLIQIRTIDEILNPVPKHIGLKVLTGAVAIGAGVYAVLLKNDYNAKLATLNKISQSADPSNSGEIANPDTYNQYKAAYDAAEAAKKKNGLFKVCIGVAAVATIAEVYLLIHKPQPKHRAMYWKPSSESAGLALGYSF